jgi:hypothetical protein
VLVSRNITEFYGVSGSELLASLFTFVLSQYIGYHGKSIEIVWNALTIEYGIISTYKHDGMLKIKSSSVKLTFVLLSHCIHIAFASHSACLNCYRRCSK